ncbi:MAG TPA: WXG100 family type VII secretion target [Bacilli bacterium]|nr:WXG100 family type VII secretion target [Bacilli bacterium]
MSDIIVNTDSVDQTGRNIKAKAESYNSLVANMYKTIESLSDVWKGADNQSYVTSANNYKRDIEELGRTIMAYGDYLQEAAKLYRDVQDTLASGAGRIGN